VAREAGGWRVSDLAGYFETLPRPFLARKRAGKAGSGKVGRRG
jgi:hypothetical protein